MRKTNIDMVLLENGATLLVKNGSKFINLTHIANGIIKTYVASKESLRTCETEEIVAVFERAGQSVSGKVFKLTKVCEWKLYKEKSKTDRVRDEKGNVYVRTEISLKKLPIDDISITEG